MKVRKPRHLRLAGSDDSGDLPPTRSSSTRSERQQILGLVEQLMLDGNRIDSIVGVLEQAYQAGKLPKISKISVKKYMTIVEQLWSDDARSSRATNRQKAVNRNLRHMSAARKAGKWLAVKGFEDNIAKLQGLYAPDHLQVSLVLNENLQKVMQDYDDSRIITEADLRLQDLRDAELYRASLETLGETKPTSEPDQIPALLPQHVNG